jgi:hypothetical protein
MTNLSLLSFDARSCAVESILQQSLAARMQQLSVSHHFVPEQSEGNKPKQHQPANPTNVPPSFPQEPTRIFENPALFEKFDIDTLCFIFYFQQGTYQQYLAAREVHSLLFFFFLLSPFFVCDCLFVCLDLTFLAFDIFELTLLYF